MAKSIPAHARRTRGSAVAASLLLSGLGACTATFSDPSADPPPVTEPMPMPPPQTADTPALPPISGGTLLVTRDDSTAVAADADRDSLWLVDLVNQQMRQRVRLASGSEPGRSVEDHDGKIHVALRRSGQVLKLDPHSGVIELVRPACPAPRGLAYDDATDDLHIACAGGELVTMKARGGDTTRSLLLDNDLRDVIVKGDHLLISRFRTAELLEVDANGVVLGRVKPQTVVATSVPPGPSGPPTTSPTTAWRTTLLPTGEVLMLHQRAIDSQVATQMGGYGSGPCPISGIVNPGLTVFNDATSMASVSNGAMPFIVSLAIDVAASRDGMQFAVVGPSAGGPTPPIALYSRGQLAPGNLCQPPVSATQPADPSMQPVAAAFDSKGQLYVQILNPPQLLTSPQMAPKGTPMSAIQFPDAEERSDEGRALFHTPTKAAIACVSCHPEGGDDSHVWNFNPIGPRRTQSLRGGIMATAPFHWDGDMKDLTTLMNTVFSGRMAGQPLLPTQIAAIGQWLDGQPTLQKTAPSDAAAVTRGQALFADPHVGCASCHSGPHFTNNQNANVGTGKVFQVPSLLGLAARAPYLHNGCAATLRDRFNPACGGGDLHGQTSQLTTGQIDDLVAYLSSL